MGQQKTLHQGSSYKLKSAIPLLSHFSQHWIIKDYTCYKHGSVQVPSLEFWMCNQIICCHLIFIWFHLKQGWCLEGGWGSFILPRSQGWAEPSLSCSSHGNIWTEKKVPEQFQESWKEAQAWQIYVPADSLGPCNLLYKVYHQAFHCTVCCLKHLWLINPSMPLLTMCEGSNAPRANSDKHQFDSKANIIK